MKNILIILFVFSVFIYAQDIENLENIIEDYEVLENDYYYNRLDNDEVKLYLEKKVNNSYQEVMAPKHFTPLKESTDLGTMAGTMLLDSGTLSKSSTINYRLRMWVDEDYNPQDDGGNLEFSVQINVYGLDGLSMEDRMMRTAGSEDFHTSAYKSSITSVVTKGDTIIPESAIESWDISEKQNGSAIAYVEDDETGSGTYKLTIGGEGKIIANYDMSIDNMLLKMKEAII